MFINRDAFFQMVEDRLGPYMEDIGLVRSLQENEDIDVVRIDNNSTTLTFEDGRRIFLYRCFPYAGQIFLT